MSHRLLHVLGDWQNWLGLATVLFAVWYAVFLFRFTIARWLAALVATAHETVPLAPAVERGTIRLLVGLVTGAGIPLTVAVLFVGFALFHRQADVA